MMFLRVRGCSTSTENGGAAVHTGDMEVFSLAYVSGSIARQVLRGVSCDGYMHA
jgi:hypothetical protein